MTTLTDVAKVLEAADTLDTHLSPAEAHGWTVMDRLDPTTRAALMARIDNDNS